MYEKIIIPTAVYKEIEKGKGKPYYLDLKLIDWIEIWGIRNLDFNVYFLDLDEGEAEVIILAKEQDADIVLMDEIMGRIIAKQFNLNVTGTIGVLLKAKERGLVNAIKEILTELQEKGTWLNTKLTSKALELAHEE